MGRKVGGRLLRPLFAEREPGPHRTQCRVGRGLSPIPSGILIHPPVWPQQTGRKIEGMCPFGERELDPHLTLWPGPRPTFTPSFILIHPTVWPQYTHVTDRSDRQTFTF